MRIYGLFGYTDSKTRILNLSHMILEYNVSML